MDRDREDALERLVSRYCALIRSVVARVAGHASSAVADDVEQRVRIALWRQIDREQTIAHPASYIYRIAVRETVRAVRQEWPPHTEPIDERGDRHMDARATPDEELQSVETGAEIRAAVGRLHVDRRRAVKAHLAGFDVREIMSMYGWSYQQARNLVARGMADLRTGLKDRPR